MPSTDLVRRLNAFELWLRWQTARCSSCLAHVTEGDVQWDADSAYWLLVCGCGTAVLHEPGTTPATREMRRN